MPFTVAVVALMVVVRVVFAGLNTPMKRERARVRSGAMGREARGVGVEKGGRVRSGAGTGAMRAGKAEASVRITDVKTNIRLLKALVNVLPA